MSDAFLNFAKDKQHAKDIFESLGVIYERKSLAIQPTCRKGLLTLKLEGNTSLIAHFTRFDEILTELLAPGAKLDEMDKVSHLLTTLPSTYN